MVGMGLIKRHRVVVAILVIMSMSLLIEAIAVQVSHEHSSRIKAAPCLKAIGSAMLLYTNASPAATQSATLPTPQPAETPRTAWAALREGGKIVLMRHASTPPGSGEPPGFNLSDRATQRNLSETGRAQARQIGTAFAREGIPISRIMSSEYFRCQDTAMLAFGKNVVDSSLNGLSDDLVLAKEQVAKLRRLIAQPPERGNVVLVTHQTNILALTGIRPDPGECIILAPTAEGNFSVIARLKADAQ